MSFSCRTLTENRARWRSAAAITFVGVVRRVRAQHQHPGRARLARRDQRVGDEPVRAAGRVRRPVAQLGGGDHRRAARRRHDREQRVQALHTGIAATGALRGVPVALAERGIDVDVGELGGARTR